jgi:hypothetical protein
VAWHRPAHPLFQTVAAWVMLSHAGASASADTSDNASN